MSSGELSPIGNFRRNADDDMTEVKKLEQNMGALNDTIRATVICERELLLEVFAMGARMGILVENVRANKSMTQGFMIRYGTVSQRGELEAILDLFDQIEERIARLQDELRDAVNND
jgi:hypothetical protein